MRRPVGAPPPVAVVGGGFAGIAAGVSLVKAGCTDFTISETSAAPGETWFDNRYPGAQVDVHSQLYSYSFRPNDRSPTHVNQAELLAYLEHVVGEYELWEHFRFGTTVEDVVWDGDTATRCGPRTGGRARFVR